MHWTAPYLYITLLTQSSDIKLLSVLLIYFMKLKLHPYFIVQLEITENCSKKIIIFFSSPRVTRDTLPVSRQSREREHGHPDRGELDERDDLTAGSPEQPLL